MKLSKLRAMSDDDLVKEHDKRTHYDFTQSQFLDEIHRRQQERHTKTMKRLTVVITILTAIVTLATIVNLFVCL